MKNKMLTLEDVDMNFQLQNYLEDDDYIEMTKDKNFNNELEQLKRLIINKTYLDLLKEKIHFSGYTYLKPKSQVYYLPYFIYGFLKEENLYDFKIDFDSFIYIWCEKNIRDTKIRNDNISLMSDGQKKALLRFFLYSKSMDSEYKSELTDSYNILHASI